MTPTHAEIRDLLARQSYGHGVGRRYSRAAKAEVALLRAHGHTWRELGEWHGVTGPAAQQQAKRGAPYAAACLIALRNATR